MNPSIQLYSITLAAAETRSFPSPGQVIAIKECSATVKLSLDDDKQNDVEGGIVMKGGFRRLTFTNENAIAVKVVFFVASDAVEFAYLKQPSTRLKSTNPNLASGATSDFSGVDSGQRRKAFIVTAGSNTANPVYIRVIAMQNGVAVGVIATINTVNEKFIIETDSDLRLHNQAADALTVYVAELFYTT